jgi:predicted Fe-Mo cluster-binding NifX family protein
MKKEKQRIAVASEGKDIDSEISLRGGRAPYYLVFEGKKLVESVKNPFAVGGGGAGWSVAHMLADKKVDLVYAGRAGPNMEFALKQKKIKFKEASGKVSKVLK